MYGVYGVLLGEDEIKLIKCVYGWLEDEYFYVLEEVRLYFVLGLGICGVKFY